jgi:hypothetical protein
MAPCQTETQGRYIPFAYYNFAPGKICASSYIEMVEYGKSKEPRRRAQILDKLGTLKLYTYMRVGLFEES